MSVHSTIEWTDATWNPLVGCSRVSAGCLHCYAERHAYRFARQAGTVYEGTARLVNGRPTFTGRVNISEHQLDAPLRWKEPRRIFVNSMSDLFHESVSDTTIAGIFGLMAACPQHTFQVLTKRPERALQWFNTTCGTFTGDISPVLHEAVKGLMGYHHKKRPAISDRAVLWPLKNVWLGVSVENQAAADERIPLLLQIPAAVRFLSCEPLIGRVDLSAQLPMAKCRNCGHDEEAHGLDRTVGCQAGDGSEEDPICGCRKMRGEADHNTRGSYLRSRHAIDWVIAGGESGPGARPMHPDWARSLRDQCAAAGVPFFFKQWGEHAPSQIERTQGALNRTNGRYWYEADPTCRGPMRRLGKKKAGRLLDGVEHSAWPINREMSPEHRGSP